MNSTVCGPKLPETDEITSTAVSMAPTTVSDFTTADVPVIEPNYDDDNDSSVAASMRFGYLTCWYLQCSAFQISR